MRFGLSDEALRAIRDVFVRHPAVSRVAVFGSRAKGTQRPNSDIDLACWGGLGDEERARILAELDELPLPQRFDLVSVERIAHPPLQEHITRVGQTIYERTSAQSP